MSTGGGISWKSALNDHINKNRGPLIQNLLSQIRDNITDVNNYIDCITVDKDYIIDNFDDIDSTLNRVVEVLSYYSEISLSEDNLALNNAIMMLNIKYLRLNNIMTNHDIETIKIFSNNLESDFQIHKENIDNNEKQLEEKQKNVLEKLENTFSTVLNLIITFSFVAAAVNGIDKIESIYIPIYLAACMWLPMTFLLFVSSIYKKEDENSKQSVFLYSIVSILTVIIIGITCYYMVNQDMIKEIENKKNNTIIEIKQK